MHAAPAVPPSAESVPRQWFRRVWNELDAGAIDELLAPDGVAHGLGAEPIRGPRGFHEFHRAFVSSFGGIHVEVLHEVIEGDLAVVRCVVSAMPAGRAERARFEGFALFRLSGGRIVEGWNTWDFAGLMEQLAILPPGALALALTGQLQPHQQAAGA